MLRPPAFAATMCVALVVLAAGGCSSADEDSSLLARHARSAPRSNGDPSEPTDDLPATDAGNAPSVPLGGGGGTGGGPRGFHVPLLCNTSASIVQGPGGSFSHNTAQSKDAYDFDIPNNTQLVSSDEGTVTFVRGDVLPGNACYNGGGQGCANTVNYVVVAHADGTDTLYLHINKSLVANGQKVKRGDPIALSGGTGWSTGPHAHVQRQQRCGIWICNSMPLDFLEADVPKTGARVTSKNCP